MARRGGRGMGLGPMAIVVAIIVGLIIAIALYSFAPVIGYTISTSTNIGTTNPWYNVTTGTGGVSSTNASTLWSTTNGLPVIMVIAIIIGGAIAIFMGI
jgi:hypothetical protein